MAKHERVSNAGEFPQSRAQALHAPWRLSYLEMLGEAERAAAKGTPQQIVERPDMAPASAPSSKASCFLREYWLNPGGDEKNHVIVRTGMPGVVSKDAGAPITQSSDRWHGSSSGGSSASRGGMILLNKYPYANGHLLVCLGDGRPRLMDYEEGQRAELWSLVDLAVDLCERTLRCQGVNVGFNQGLAAGAGVPEHVHVHVVPRWFGDVNFFTTVGHVRVIPSALEDMGKRYREVWGEVRKEMGLKDAGRA